VLTENRMVDSGGGDYGERYLPSDRTRRHWETVEDPEGAESNPDTTPCRCWRWRAAFS
jgi:hypothetical protein